MARPKENRVLAIDLGKSRVGVAISDELLAFAHPRPFLDGKNRRVLLEKLVAMANEEEVTRILVGLPKEMGGQMGTAAKGAYEFAKELAEASGREVEMIDERLSTVDALRQLRASGRDARKSKEKVDGVAAALLLQAWLDQHAARGRD